MKSDWKQNRIKDQYYIDRYGKCHYYTGDDIENVTSVHYQIAHKIYPKDKYPEDNLKKLGWITIGSTSYHNPVIYKEPSQSQINKLENLGILEDLLIKDGDYLVNYNRNFNN